MIKVWSVMSYRSMKKGKSGNWVICGHLVLIKIIVAIYYMHKTVI